MQKSLLGLIERTKTRLKPTYNKYMKRNTIWTVTGTIAGSLLSIALFQGANSIEGMAALKVFLTIIGILTTFGSLVSIMLLFLIPFDLWAFNKGKGINPFFDGDEEKFKLTHEEVQELIHSGLNIQQKEFLIKYIKEQGYVTYMDLISVNELVKKFSQYKQDTMAEDTRLALFCEDNNVELGNFSPENNIKEVEMEWGETKPLKNWL